MLLLCALLLLAPARSALLWVHSPDISVCIDSTTGQLSSLNTSWGFATPPDFAGSILAGQDLRPAVSAVSASPCSHNGFPAVCINSTFKVLGERSDASCCQSYDVSVQQAVWPLAGLPGPVPSALGWRVSFFSAAPQPWRTLLQARLAFGEAGAGDALYWAPQGGRDDENEALAWRDTLAPLRAGAAADLDDMQYGNDFLCSPQARPACMGQLLPVPLALHASAAQGAGVGLVAALDDAIFGLRLSVNASALSFTRQFNRLASAQAGAVTMTHFLVPTPGTDWRPLFAWGRAAFPRFFLAPSLLASTPALGFTATHATPRDLAELARWAAGAAAGAAPPPPLLPPPSLAHGLGIYSCANVQDMNLSQVRDASGATLNWDAHFYWPYIGQYLPSIEPPSASWASNVGSGEEGECGPGWRHGDNASYASIAAQYAASTAAGITTLSYLNLNEWGEEIRCQLPPPQAPPPANDWRNSTQFLANHMPSALLPGCPGTGWQGGVVLDSGDAAFAAFLEAQAQLKVRLFGEAFKGISFDRYDHASTWVHAPPPARDDGLAWCGDPCYPLLRGFIALLGRIGRVLQAGGAQRITTGNYVGTLRVDTLQYNDGVFSEDDRRHLTLVYSAGVSTTGKPVNVLWTYDDTFLGYSPSPDAYFAQHVAMKAFPMAPVLGADHTIGPPSDLAQSYYSAWAPLFAALRGGCWWLADTPVLARSAGNSSRALLANAFTTGGGCTAPAVAGGNGPVGAVLAFAYAPDFGARSGEAALLTLAAPLPFAGALPPSRCQAVAPGGQWQDTPLPASAGGRWAFEALPMARGAVLLRCFA